MRGENTSHGGAPLYLPSCAALAHHSNDAHMTCTHSDTPIVFVVWRAGMKVRAEYSPTNSIRCRDREVGSRYKTEFY